MIRDLRIFQIKIENRHYNKQEKPPRRERKKTPEPAIQYKPDKSIPVFSCVASEGF